MWAQISDGQYDLLVAVLFGLALLVWLAVCQWIEDRS